MSFLRAYMNIFSLDSKDIRLNRVKLISGPSEKGVYDLIGIITIPTVLSDVKSNENEVIRMRNKLRTEMKKLGGPDVIHKFKKKDSIFDFSYQLSHESVLDFEIINGMYFIKLQMYGLFYS